mgnify:FL=1
MPFVRELMMAAVASGGGGSSDYWIATIGGAGTTLNLSCIALDSAGNIYVADRLKNTPTWSPIVLIKYSSSGDIQWQKRLSGNAEDSALSIATDGTSIYITGYSRSIDTIQVAYLAKYSCSDGALMWQIGRKISPYALFNNVALASTGDVYAVGNFGTNTGAIAFIMKFTSSGSLSWQKSLGSGSNNVTNFNGVVVGSDGSVYVSGLDGGGNYDLILAKYSSAGALQTGWPKTLVGSSTNDIGYDLALDSSGNIYIAGISNSSQKILITKYNSTGTHQWHRTLYDNTSNILGFDIVKIAIDSNNNIYIAAISSNHIIIAKYNSSGVVQWQRYLTKSINNFNNSSVDIAVIGSALYIVSTKKVNAPVGPAEEQGLLVRLPLDGTLTGTYDGWVYSASTLTEQNGILTVGTRTLTAATSTLLATIGTLTSENSSFTIAKTPVG